MDSLFIGGVLTRTSLASPCVGVPLSTSRQTERAFPVFYGDRSLGSVLAGLDQPLKLALKFRSHALILIDDLLQDTGLVEGLALAMRGYGFNHVGPIALDECLYQLVEVTRLPS